MIRVLSFGAVVIAALTSGAMAASDGSDVGRATRAHIVAQIQDRHEPPFLLARDQQSATWDQAVVTLRSAWNRLNSRRSMGGDDSRDNIPAEQTVLAAMEQIVELSLAEPLPVTVERYPVVAQQWGVLAQSKRDLELNGLPASQRYPQMDRGRLGAARAALTAQEEVVAAALRSTADEMKPSVSAALATAKDPRTLDAALRSSLGISMQSVCGFEPYIDRSLSGPEMMPRANRILSPALESEINEKCSGYYIARHWSPEELRRKDPAMSTGSAPGFRFTVPARYSPPTADEIRRAIMREASEYGSAVLLDENRLLLSGENTIARGFGNAVNRTGPMAGIGFGGYSKTAPGFVQTIKSVRRKRCTASTLGGYVCVFDIDLDLEPNARGASIGGPLQALAQSMNTQGPRELTYRFQFTRVGWRSPDLAKQFEESSNQAMISFLRSVSSAAAGAAAVICNVGSGANEAWAQNC